MAFPILPGMDFQWIDPEGTPNRRWRARMPREVFQQVVNIRLYGSHPPPPGNGTNPLTIFASPEVVAPGAASMQSDFIEKP